MIINMGNDQLVFNFQLYISKGLDAFILCVVWQDGYIRTPIQACMFAYVLLYTYFFLLGNIGWNEEINNYVHAHCDASIVSAWFISHIKFYFVPSLCLFCYNVCSCVFWLKHSSSWLYTVIIITNTYRGMNQVRLFILCIVHVFFVFFVFHFMQLLLISFSFCPSFCTLVSAVILSVFPPSCVCVRVCVGGMNICV